jgi:hypothetical protein
MNFIKAAINKHTLKNDISPNTPSYPRMMLNLVFTPNIHIYINPNGMPY